MNKASLFCAAAILSVGVMAAQASSSSEHNRYGVDGRRLRAPHYALAPPPLTEGRASALTALSPTAAKPFNLAPDANDCAPDQPHVVWGHHGAILGYACRRESN